MFLKGFGLGNCEVDATTGSNPFGYDQCEKDETAGRNPLLG